MKRGDKFVRGAADGESVKASKKRASASLDEAVSVIKVIESSGTQEIEDFEEFVADEASAEEAFSLSDVEMDRERWWSLLVKAVGGSGRLPRA